MKLKGLRVLLSIPDPPDSKLFLNEKIKNELLEEQMKKMDRLEVYMVGEEVKGLTAGDIVYVPANDLRQASVVEIDGKTKALVNSLSIAIIW